MMPRRRSATDFGTAANSLLPLKLRATVLNLRFSGMLCSRPDPVLNDSLSSRILRDFKSRVSCEGSKCYEAYQRRSGHSIHSSKRCNSDLFRR